MILTFDFESQVPLYLQLRNQVVVGIADGTLKPGEKLPSVRALAEESGINMMTVSKAYQLLKREGYISTDRRSGASVAQKTPTTVPEDTLRELKLSLSELSLSGMSRDEILALIERLLKEGGIT